MKGRGRALSALALLLVLGVCAQPGLRRPLLPTGSDNLFVAGYHPWWGLSDSATYPTGSLDQVFLFEWEAAADGSLADLHGWPEAWAPLTEQLTSRAVGVVPTVTLYGPEAFQELFESEAATERLRTGLVNLLARSPEVSGLHLDVEVFEPVSDESRQGYSAFVARLGQEVRTRFPGATLSVFLPALDGPDAYDELRLASASDYVVVQGYDLHYRTGPTAGPVSPLTGWDGMNLAAVVGRYAGLGIPGDRILLSLPLYGYEWPTETGDAGSDTRGAGVNLPLWASPEVEPHLPRAVQQAAEYGVRRSGPGETPWYAYRTGEGWRQGWFDDARSLALKVEFVRDQGLAGVAFFPLIYGTADTWLGLEEALRP